MKRSEEASIWNKASCHLSSTHPLCAEKAVVATFWTGTRENGTYGSRIRKALPAVLHGNDRRKTNSLTIHIEDEFRGPGYAVVVLISCHTLLGIKEFQNVDYGVYRTKHLHWRRTNVCVMISSSIRRVDRSSCAPWMLPEMCKISCIWSIGTTDSRIDRRQVTQTPPQSSRRGALLQIPRTSHAVAIFCWSIHQGIMTEDMQHQYCDLHSKRTQNICQLTCHPSSPSQTRPNSQSPPPTPPSP